MRQPGSVFVPGNDPIIARGADDPAYWRIEPHLLALMGRSLRRSAGNTFENSASHGRLTAKYGARTNAAL